LIVGSCIRGFDAATRVIQARAAGEPQNIPVSLAPLASLHMRLPVIAAQP
jgi:hypothetical protein